MFLSFALTYLYANRHAFFSFSEHNNCDKKSHGPFRAHSFSIVTYTLAQSTLYVDLTLKLKR